MLIIQMGAAFSSIIAIGHTYQEGFDISSFEFRIGDEGSRTELVVDSSSHYIYPAADMEGFTAGWVRAIVPEGTRLAPGDTMYITYTSKLSSTVECAGKVYPVISTKAEYQNICGVEYETNYIQLRRRLYHGNASTYDVEIPSDMYAGETYTLKFLNGYLMSERPGIFKYVFQLPPGVVFTGDANSFSGFFRTDDMEAIPAPDDFTYDPVTRTITAEFEVASGSKFLTHNNNFILEDVSLDCSGDVTTGPASFGLSGLVQPVGCEEYSVFCRTYNTLVHCGTECARGGISSPRTTVRRTNYGAPDNDNNGIPDESGEIDFSKVATGTVIHGDTLAYIYSGRVFYGDDSPEDFISGYVETQFPGLAYAAWLVPVEASVAIYNASGMLIGEQAGIPFSKPSGLFARVNYSISELSSFPSEYTRFNHGDSIVVTALFTINQTTTVEQRNDVTSNNTMYLTNIETLPSAASDEYYCDITGGNWRLLGVFRAQNSLGSMDFTSCGQLVRDRDYYVGVGLPTYGYHAGEAFTHEYRPVAIADTASLVLPEGYEMVSAQAFIMYSTGEYTTQSTPLVTIEPVVVSGDTMKFDLAALFEPGGGEWMVPDEAYRTLVRYTIRPLGCTTPETAQNYFGGMSYKSFSGKELPLNGTQFNGFAGSSISYRKPQLTLSSAEVNKTVNTTSVSWNVQIGNTTPGSAMNNVWLSKKSGIGTVNITEVALINTSTGAATPLAANADGLYELGNISAATNRVYRITGDFENCIKDSIRIVAGWNCAGYPAGEADAAEECKKELTLNVTAQNADLQLAIIDQPSAAVELCETLDFEIEVINSGLGTVEEPAVMIRRFQNMEYVAGTLELRAPGGAYASLDDANFQVLPGGNARITVSSQVADFLSTENYRVKFQVKTMPCGFSSGTKIDFQPIAKNQCDDNVSGSSQTSNRINIVGAPDVLPVYIITSSVEDAVACGSGNLYTLYRFKVVNNGVNPSGSTDGWRITLPEGWEMNTSAISYLHNPTSASFDESTPSGYDFNMGSGLAVGDSIVFTTTLTSVSADPAICGTTEPIIEAGFVKFTATCIDPIQVCDIIQLLEPENSTTVINIVKPSYTMDLEIDEDATRYSSSIIGTVTLTRSTDVYVDQDVTISLYHDANSNGVYDAGEELLGSTLTAVSADGVQEIPFSIATGISDPTVLNSIVAVAVFDCACSDASDYVTNVALPVQLVSFRASSDACDGVVVWETSDESGMVLYEVEHSTDGRTFRSVGQQSPSNGLSLNRYEFRMALPSVTSYFRLRMVDVNGTDSYSPVSSGVSRGSACGSVMSRVYPNPSGAFVYIELSDFSAGSDVSYELSGMNGQVVSGGILSQAVTELDLTGYSSGSYILRIVVDGVPEVHKLELVK